MAKIETKKKFRKILDEAYMLYEIADADYGDDGWRELGMFNRFHDIHRKYIRIRSIIIGLRKPKRKEKLRDTLIDLLVYCVLAIIKIDEMGGYLYDVKMNFKEKFRRLLT